MDLRDDQIFRDYDVVHALHTCQTLMGCHGRKKSRRGY
jgi:hypothetical protein